MKNGCPRGLDIETCPVLTLDLDSLFVVFRFQVTGSIAAHAHEQDAIYTRIEHINCVLFARTES